MSIDSSEAELDDLLAQLDDGEGLEAEIEDLPDMEDEWRSSKRLSQALSIKIDDDFDLDSLDLDYDEEDKKSSSSSSSEDEALPQPRESEEAPPPSIEVGASLELDVGGDSLDFDVDLDVGSDSSYSGGPTIDDLEADLDSLDVTSTPTPPPEPTVETVRSSSRQRAGTRSAGCAGCGKELSGDALQACGRLWHPSCFNCKTCKTPLGTKEFFESESGTPYCMGCAKKEFLPSCDRCRAPIEGRMLKAMGKQFHEKCFSCRVCNAPFPDGTFWENAGEAYCKTHYYEKFGIRCAGCSGVITSDKALKALGKFWHKECFTCASCGRAFPDGQFYEKDGKPYCKEHYSVSSGSICAKCGTTITGTMIKALGKTWCSGCFTCTSCSSPLSGSVMMVKRSGREEPWCNSCYTSSFKS